MVPLRLQDLLLLRRLRLCALPSLCPARFFAQPANLLSEFQSRQSSRVFQDKCHACRRRSRAGVVRASDAAIMLDFFGFSDIFMDRQHNISQLGTYLLFYGLYFGVMGRDFAEVTPTTTLALASCHPLSSGL